MTSRAGPTILERILDGREPLLDLMSEYRAAIEQEVRDEIRARLEGPVRALHRWDCSRPASEFNEPLAEIVRTLAISSSSATETDGMTHRELLAYKAGELAGRQAERLGVSATETQDGLPDANRVGGYSAYGEPYAEDAYDSATETQDGERPGLAPEEAVDKALLYAFQLSNLDYAAIKNWRAPEAFIRALEQDGYTISATPTPDDRDREEFAQAAEPIVRWYMEHVADPEVVAKWAGLRASGGTE